MAEVSGIPIIYEDSGFLILDKPSGLLSQPGLGVDRQDSLLSRVKACYPWAELVHRLDRDTSGLITVALDPEIHRAISIAFSVRRVDKHYVGVCEGHLEGKHGTVVSPLARIGTDPPRYAEHPEGKIAVTEWQNLGFESHQTRVKLLPVTGRSHQLRVHLHALGHPLVGDPIYGETDGERLKLHAERLTFLHPRTENRIVAVTTCPF